MPIYEFKCEACDHYFESMQKFSDPNPTQCPACNKGPVEKKISLSAFALKGTGFYTTDYKRKENPSSSKKRDGEKENQQSDSTKETKTETTSDSKAETKSETKEATPKTEKKTEAP